MNKVMVTGLAVGSEIGKEIGSCGACNFDLSWLFENPSILLWVEKIVLTPIMWDVIVNEKFPSRREEFSKAIKFVFEKLNSEGIIEIYEPNKFIDNSMILMIKKQVSKDMELLADNFPTAISLNFSKKEKNGKISPDNIKIGEYEYCSSYLSSLYGSLMISRLNGSHPLFNNHSFEYLKYRFGIDINDCQVKTKSFNSLFNMLLPNNDLFPEIVFVGETKCNTCIKINDCKRNYLKELDNNLSELLTWRKYDEICQIKTVINNIIDDYNKSDIILNSDDIIKKYQEKENKANGLIRSTFPKVKRFANITTLASLPFAVIGVATGDALMTVPGVSVAALAQAGKEIMQLLESKFRWVGFLKKNN